MVPARPPIPHPSRLADELVADTETMRGAGVRCLSSIGSLGIRITTGWEGSMIGSKLALNLAMALCLCTLVCSSAWAFDLTGAWATAEAACPKVFLKDENKVSLTADSDIYGGGFAVDGNQIVGKMARCRINSTKQDGAVLRVSATCLTDIMHSEAQFSFEIAGENRMWRKFSGMPDMDMEYVRCQL